MVSDSLSGERPMTFTATRRRPKPRTFHATMLVTRAEEWCVEARTAEEARRLLARGEGHRCHLGDCVQIELQHMLNE